MPLMSTDDRAEIRKIERVIMRARGYLGEIPHLIQAADARLKNHTLDDARRLADRRVALETFSGRVAAALRVISVATDALNAARRGLDSLALDPRRQPELPEDREREDVTPQGEWSGDRGMVPESEPAIPPALRQGFITIGRAVFREIDERAKSSEINVSRGAILGMAAITGRGYVLRSEAEFLDRGPMRRGSEELDALVREGLLLPPGDDLGQFTLTTHGAVYVRALLSMDNGPLLSTLEVVEYASTLIAHLDQTGVCDVCGAEADDFNEGDVPHHEGTVCWNLARALKAGEGALPDPKLPGPRMRVFDAGAETRVVQAADDDEIVSIANEMTPTARRLVVNVPIERPFTLSEAIAALGGAPLQEYSYGECAPRDVLEDLLDVSPPWRNPAGVFRIVPGTADRFAFTDDGLRVRQHILEATSA